MSQIPRWDVLTQEIDPDKHDLWTMALYRGGINEVDYAYKGGTLQESKILKCESNIDSFDGAAELISSQSDHLCRAGSRA